MITIRSALHRLRLGRLTQRGASAVEYGLLITGIAAIIAIAVFLFGGAVINLFSDTCKGLASARGSGSCS